ncbi:TonB-dependent receptor plug domain-containing protein [Psychromonas sp. PT13]|uniref:TonB-dependent receptor plug domain-containing protein n=1 Tax=Psychromonas sp. PT13 TaxID=3439547 RepID=UPI003EB745B8
MTKYHTLLLSITVSSLLYSQATRVHAEENNVESFNLTDLPSLELDELLATDVQVTSAMKRLQNVSETAASIYVLTHDEIISSGVTSVAQALKLVPGMQVRQIDSNQWAISTRSSAGRYSSKLLVMIDGQSIYNPGFAGVYWEALNTPLYDIERIEVIRGQGGLLWGSNATNGVVNIITKHTADTQGVLTQVEAGNMTDFRTSFRIGGEFANYNSYRIYADVDSTDSSDKGTAGQTPNDSGEKKNIGARLDLSLSDDLSLLAQTEYSEIKMGQVSRLFDLDTYEKIYVDEEASRKHLQVMGRLEHKLSSVSNQMIQASVSSQKGNQSYYKEHFIISDLDYQMNTLISNVQFDWGGNYRYMDISITDTDYITSIDNINSYQQYGGFVQAQFNLIPEKLKLIIGDRSERNSFTGWEHQPMARLLWKPKPDHTFWGAVSRGVRIPSLIEYNGIAMASGISVGKIYDTGVDSINNLRIKAQIVGSSDIEAETSISKELGYRHNGEDWGFDVSLFHTKSKDVTVVEESYDEDTFTEIATLIYLGEYDAASALINSTTFDYKFVSSAELITYGGELAVKWQPIKRLKTELGVSYTSFEYNLPSGTRAAFGFDTELWQVMAKADYALTPTHSLFAVYHIESGDAYETDDYSVLDLTWNWQISPAVSFSLTGNNLLYGSHLEYADTSQTYTVPTYIEPSYIARFTMEF